MSESATHKAVRPGSGAMFDQIAHRYDFANRVLSAGLDKLWRRRAVRTLLEGTPADILDVATGTGDVALALRRAFPDARVVGLDPSPKMLALAGRKGTQKKAGIEWIEGAAERLPFEADAFDAVTVAFGVRNMADRAQGLRELRRVLRPRGRLVVLEFSEPQGTALSRAVRFHIRHVVPRLGAMLVRAPEYRYLQTSIAAFPSPDSFCAMLKEAGFAEATATPLTFGACWMFVADVAKGRGDG